MNLVNISNDGRIVHLFTRNKDGQLEIKTVDDFYPFFYEPDPQGDAIGYDGVRLRRFVAEKPSDVKSMRSPKSYSSDIRYPIVYLSQMVDRFDKCPFKYFFLDIEVLLTELRDPKRIAKEATDPISCVTIYNSQKKEYISFYLGDYQGRSIAEKENKLKRDLINYFQSEKPDLWLSWNVDFDYTFLHNRIKDFAKAISPIGQARMGRGDDKVYYPAGISILDYLSMFKKVNLRESSYALDAVAEKHLGYGKKHKKVDFSELTPELKARNREDVELLVDLEKKFKILDYFDEIRRFSHALWEDLTHNSMILDSIILAEARKRNVILPRKPEREEDDETLDDLIGAYRRAEPGLYFDIYDADVASMYPNQLVNFCLDPVNIRKIEKDVPGYDKGIYLDSDIIEINGVYFKQDQNAMLPYLAKQLMGIKDNLKAQLKASAETSEERKVLQMKYDAYKGLVNSLFGVTAFPSFRLYNNDVASAITFLARDLLKYVEEQMNKKGHSVIYTDTDALMYRASRDEIDLLNDLVQDWGAEHSKAGLTINFESSGKFEKLLIVGKCHYYGYVEGKKKPQIKGMEIKRASSSKYEGKFQEQLIEKILDRQTKEVVLKWVDGEKVRVRSLPAEEISFPCKLADRKYKTETIFIRAYNNTRLIKPDFKVALGDNFLYVFVHPLGLVDQNGKPINVLAFTKDNKDFLGKWNIDYDEIIRRNIDSKTEAIFEAIGWDNKKKPVATLF